MGSEQSQHAAEHGLQGRSANATRLQRGNTIAVSGRRMSSPQEDPGSINSISRPASPPISVCSDSDLPYVSYTDKPIGGKFLYMEVVRFILTFYHLVIQSCRFYISDSPKYRNKATISNSVRSNRNVNASKKTNLSKTKAKSLAHDIVVVREANKKGGIDFDPDVHRLNVITKLIFLFF